MKNYKNADGSTTYEQRGSKVTVHETASLAFVVAENEVWVTGVYATAEAACFAVTVDPDKLVALWKARCPVPMSLGELQWCALSDREQRGALRWLRGRMALFGRRDPFTRSLEAVYETLRELGDGGYDPNNAEQALEDEGFQETPQERPQPPPVER